MLSPKALGPLVLATLCVALLGCSDVNVQEKEEETVNEVEQKQIEDSNSVQTGVVVSDIEDEDSNGLERISPRYTKDATSVFYARREIPNADVASFEVLDFVVKYPYGDFRPLSRDSNTLYFEGVPLADIPPDTSVVQEGHGYFFLQMDEQLKAIVPVGGGEERLVNDVVLLDVASTELERWISENSDIIYDVKANYTHWIYYDDERYLERIEGREGQFTVDF